MVQGVRDRMMLSGALFVLASVLIIVLLRVFNSLKLSRNNIQSLQENLDHSRSKLADYETQVDELNYEMTQLRMQLGSARTELNKYKQYQDICDIEQYIINRSLQAENFVEVTKLDASIMLDDLKAYIAQVKAYLQNLQTQAEADIERQARKALQAYYQQAKEQQRLQEVVEALEHKIKGYQHGFDLPVTQLLDQLISGYNDTDAARHLLTIRTQIEQAKEQQQVASCNYVDEDRRKSTIAILSLAFNSRAEFYLSQLNTHNLGEMLQALKDDYRLMNYKGQSLSQAMIQESYLNLRLEELKFAAVLLQLRQNQVSEPPVVITS
jgi:soluble cytochrome b562